MYSLDCWEAINIDHRDEAKSIRIEFGLDLDGQIFQLYFFIGGKKRENFVRFLKIAASRANFFNLNLNPVLDSQKFQLDANFRKKPFFPNW